MLKICFKFGIFVPQMMKKNLFKIQKPIFDDEAMLVLNKPAGLLTVPDRHDPQLPNLRHILQDKYGPVIPVHRLDKETSGVICFAKTKEDHKFLNEEFQNRRVGKKYIAFISGTPAENEGTLDYPIEQHPSILGKMRISPRGKDSLTKYKVLETIGPFSLVEVDLLTGRTHQIRLHFSHLGHPVIADTRYGNGKSVFLSDFKKNFKQGRFKEERALIGSLALHSRQLSLTHPRSNKEMLFEAELNKEFSVALKQLRKYVN